MVAYVRLDEVLGIMGKDVCRHFVKDGGYGKYCIFCGTFNV